MADKQQQQLHKLEHARWRVDYFCRLLHSHQRITPGNRNDLWAEKLDLLKRRCAVAESELAKLEQLENSLDQNSLDLLRQMLLTSCASAPSVENQWRGDLHGMELAKELPNVFRWAFDEARPGLTAHTRSNVLSAKSLE
jgi:hypothetical protein